MQALNKQATKVLDKLVAGLAPGEARKIDNTDEAFMPVHVDCLADDTFAVAHYYRQNGDAMADPDVVFWRCAGRYYPTEITQAGFGHYDRVLFVTNGVITAVKHRAYRDLKVFCGTWMRNVKEQQGL